jgi:hypothetical protein
VIEKRYLLRQSVLYWQCRGPLHGPGRKQSGAWLVSSARSLYCQGVWPGIMSRPYRRESLLRRCGALGVWSRRLRAYGKRTPFPERSVRPERRARQRADDSAFAGPRSPAPRASGGASGSGRAALKSCWYMMVSTRHRTRDRCGCQPYFSLAPLTRRPPRHVRAATPGPLEGRRRLGLIGVR